MISHSKKKHQLITRHFLQGLLLFLFIACHTIPLEAQAKQVSVLMSRNEMNLSGICKRIELRGDVTVILTNEPSGNLLLEGNPADCNKVKAVVKNGKLFIDAEKKTSFKKMTIYLPITTVTALLVTGDAEILSSGTIKANGLEIILNGSSFVTVHYEGKLKVSPAAGIELLD